jgi:hypothetical protein
MIFNISYAKKHIVCCVLNCTRKHKNITYLITYSPKKQYLVKHTFHHLVKVTLLLRLLSANCQPGCPPPIHLSSLPWLVVALPLVMLHPPPRCLYNVLPHSLVLLPRNLHLSSCQGAAGFQDAAASCLLVPPADCHNASCHAATTSRPLDNPLPLVCKCLPSHWPLVCQLVVMSPLLSRRHRLLSSQHAASASRPLNTPPRPRNKLPLPHNMPLPLVCWCLISHLPLYCWLVVTSHLIAPLPQVSILNPHLHSHWLDVASHLIVLLPPTVLLPTLPPLDLLVTHLLFASCSPQLVACVFDLVCPISPFMAICQGYAPAYLPLKPGHKNQLKSKVQRSKSSLFSCRVRCQEYMGST